MTLVKIIGRSNILYVWINDITVNLFKFSAGIQRNGLDCKMLHSVFRTTLRTANMLIWGHDEKGMDPIRTNLLLYAYSPTGMCFCNQLHQQLTQTSGEWYYVVNSSTIAGYLLEVFIRL